MSRLKCVFVLVACLSLATSALADTINIPVPNGNFDSPSIPSGESFLLAIPANWSTLGMENAGTSYAGLSNAVDPFFFWGSDGNSDGWLYQADIGTNVAGAGYTYTLSFDYANDQATGLSLTAKIGTNAGTVALTEQTYSVGGWQGWTHGSISGITTASNTGALGVIFYVTKPVAGDHQFWVDHVTLSQTSPIPEPATSVLAGCGLVGLLAYAWRKR